MTSEQRRENYACDITYVTNSELGFDFLRDNLAMVSLQIGLINTSYLYRPLFICVITYFIDQSIIYLFFPDC